jgi:hypothetical protein
MDAPETLANEPASVPRWVSWLVVGVLVGAGMVIMSATDDSAAPVPPGPGAAAPTPTSVRLQSSFEILPSTAPRHCFPTAYMAEHMMLDWRVQVRCVRAYLSRHGAAHDRQGRTGGRHREPWPRCCGDPPGRFTKWAS